MDSQFDFSQLRDFSPTPYSVVGGKTGISASGSSSSSLYSDPATKVNFNPTDLSPILSGQRDSSVLGLQSLQKKVQQQSAIRKALSDYDALYASTKATGFQAADNAGTTYANRLMQAGVNPTASGVVTAQSKLPVYSALAQINQQKSATRLDAVQKADALAAQIASTIGSIQLNYSKTLADYNTSLNAQHLNAGEFNAQQRMTGRTSDRSYALQAQQLRDQEAAQAAALAASGNSNGIPNITPDYSPGYITNSGPLIPDSNTTNINPNVSVGRGNGTIGVPFFTPPSKKSTNLF